VVVGVNRRIGGIRPALLVGCLVLVGLSAGGCSSAKASVPTDWSIFWRSIFQPDGLILSGLWLTVSIAVISQTLGLILGILAALARMAKAWPFRLIAGVYIWLFRGTPLLVQIMLVYFGLPAVGLYDFPTFTVPIINVAVPNAVQAGIIALSLNEGAYMAEIVRAGILSIDPGQTEAAKSLGMTYSQTMRRIVLPQAARVIIPPLGNEFNNMLKTTSLLVVIGVRELFVIFSYKNTTGSTSLQPFALFLACAVWYLMLTTIWGFIQARIERKFGKGAAGNVESEGLLARVFGARGSSQVEGGMGGD
jgi:polar amino acid transport system permease protein